jgi:transposase-like protein
MKNTPNIKKYVKNGGNFCPFCNSDNISADLPLNTDYIEGGIIKQDLNCWDCGKTWNDVYKLTSIEETK